MGGTAGGREGRRAGRHAGGREGAKESRKEVHLLAYNSSCIHVLFSVVRKYFYLLCIPSIINAICVTKGRALGTNKSDYTNHELQVMNYVVHACVHVIS